MDKLEVLWQKAFNDAVGAEQEKSGTNPLDWRCGGKATKEWPDKENGDWWNAKGLDMLVKFTEVWEASGLTIWKTPEGVSALELEVNVNYGQVYVKAFIDCVAVTADGQLVVVDYKTGKSMPSGMQLGLYASSMEKTFGTRPTHGYYYDARKAVLVPVQIDRWTPALFTEMFRQFEFAVTNKIFLPNVGMSCSTCSVGDYCYANDGKMASLMDPLHQFAQNKDK